MMRPCSAAVAVLALLIAGCVENGETQQGTRGSCAAFGGHALGCEVPPIETAGDACWRMVECGAIPVRNPEDEPDCCFDWAHCVDYLEGLEAWQFDYALACVATAACDELKFEGSPTRPRRSEQRLPLCLQFGDE